MVSKKSKKKNQKKKKKLFSKKSKKKKKKKNFFLLFFIWLKQTWYWEEKVAIFNWEWGQILAPYKRAENPLRVNIFSDFIWPFLRPYIGVIPNPKMAFIFPISCILALIFPILIKYFPKCVGKGIFPKSQIKSLNYYMYYLCVVVGAYVQ